MANMMSNNEMVYRRIKNLFGPALEVKIAKGS
jgi:hypothetical protein